MRDRADRINAFLLRAADSADFGSLFAALCGDLVEVGLPLLRASVGYQTLDPIVRARSDIWYRAGGLAREEATHGDGDSQFQRSPIRHLIGRDQTFGRWRLDQGEGGEFPLLAELQARGATDYILHLVRFHTGAAMIPGVAISFAADRPGGLTADEMADLTLLVPALGLASGRASVTEMTRSVLGLYLGPRSAAHVLDGEIRRGIGRRIDAAILMADLRGFTALADVSEPLDLVAWLDEHLDTIADAVAVAGGEVLKFLGDGLLAVFPDEVWDGSAAACLQALRAAEAAQGDNARLNRRRRTHGAPTLALDIALHHGEVVYGNVGSTHRLDFTIVGRAVNEASRIEALCAELERPLLLSETFAAHCGRPTVSLGAHRLRGVQGTREIRALA